MVGWGQGSRDPEPQPTVEEKDINWNTHNKIREHFNYPLDEELFGDWLQWFYALTADQKQMLRNTNLGLINVEAFPPRPHSTKEKS